MGSFVCSHFCFLIIVESAASQEFPQQPKINSSILATFILIFDMLGPPVQSSLSSSSSWMALQSLLNSSPFSNMAVMVLCGWQKDFDLS
jgi:hypothetical protein